MTEKERAFQIEELQMNMEKIYSLQNAIFSSIYESKDDSKNYEWAFVLLIDVTFEIKNKLNEMQIELFEAIKGSDVNC